LLASISHDLRTPLAVMAGAGSTLATRTSSLDEATRIALARSIETKAREMSELVSNVLDLTRLDAGEVVLNREPEHLDELVGAALNRYDERLAGHPIDVRIPDDLPSVLVDATLVVQVFGNLLDNAAKYTPAGTRVCIAAASDGAFVRVTVDDDGPGLPPGDPSELFEKFRRGAREATIIGAGLGLAICRAIVQAHGGSIEAKRRAGGGTRFELTLPVAEAAA
jgi:two-component system sensor histidine kinase KdpD